MRSSYELMIIKRLENYRKKHGLKQKDLANRLDWTPQEINDILKERIPIGRTRQLHIEKKLGISLNIDQTLNLNEDDIEIAQMAHGLTKDEKEALKTIIHGLAKEKTEAA